ncbi:hypothetical protein R4K20_01690 [Pseudomonas aeruginosa]|uniref:hypothetical protein n=1 Tax=Pseudomonas aeruginosa TaxID=287 RepID=UPI002954D5AF|nr:hypothetical protein [Pseudomonas aeruginosa]MDV7920390.1 hypothetical protein [Pseudomonas aeruginosa]
MSSIQLIEQCVTRLRGIIEALDNIHDTSPHRWSTDLDDVHSSAESLLALIKDQAPTQAAQGLAGAALAQPSPAPELERPEVAEVAFVLRNIGAMDAEDIDGDNVDLRFEDAEGRDTGCDVSIVEYAEKAADLFEQHDRIVGALRAENAKLSEALDRWPLIRDSLKLRLADALARVAELEKQEPVALANRGIHAFWVKWTEAAAGLYGPGIKLYAHPVAQAQHSVPEEFIGRLSEFLAQRGATGKALLRELRTVLAAAPGREVPQAWLDVQAERRRQVEAEGWTPEHDDEHNGGELADAAACYALSAAGWSTYAARERWPWPLEWWKPSTARRDLVKACALALAEIERLDRAGISQNPQPGATTASS